MKNVNWKAFLSLAALPLVQLLLGAVLLLNPDGALAAIFRIIGWLLVAAALICAFAVAADRSHTTGGVIGAVICGIGGALLLRNPLILAASTKLCTFRCMANPSSAKRGLSSMTLRRRKSGQRKGFR